MSESASAGTFAGAGPRSDALIIFGASGDLARKQLFRAAYRLSRRGLLDVPVIGVAITGWDDDALRERARESIEASPEHVDPGVLDALLARMRYVRGDYRDPATFDALAESLGGRRRPLFHLAIPPALFADVADGLATAGLNRTGRLMVEKPFGHDLASARELNRRLRRHFEESAIFRLDHYLGKEPLRNLMVLRFANEIFEPLWSAEHVAEVAITMAEAFDASDRGTFYDATGAIRDVLQNHLVQMVALVAMEEPASEHPDHVRDAKIAAIDAIRPIQLVRGQYEGFRSTDGVAPDSTTETYAALRLEIDTPRWRGVPFLLRTGKALPATVTQISLEFRRPERPLFLGVDCPANSLRIPLKPVGPARMIVIEKRPGEEMRTRATRYGPDEPSAADLADALEPYELLIEEAMAGDPTQFAREDGVLAAWRATERALALGGPVEPYPRGSWGPPAGAAMAGGIGGWPEDRGELEPDATPAG